MKILHFLESQLRLRIFAGPNGSGKSTVIDSVKGYMVNGQKIDFGYYINADDIARKLRDATFSFNGFNIPVANKEFRAMALGSGLVKGKSAVQKFDNSHTLRKNSITLKDNAYNGQLAQIIADYLRKRLLKDKKKFSFETVFSHPSKLDIMRQAVAAGYKVYLYFVSTESPEINKFRVEARVKQGGHDVPANKIVDRYYRSLNLLYEACQLAYQVFFFDNSTDGSDLQLFAHFKKTGDVKIWDDTDQASYPGWFKIYYSGKISS